MSTKTRVLERDYFIELFAVIAASLDNIGLEHGSLASTLFLIEIRTQLCTDLGE